MDTIVVGPPEEGAQDFNLADPTEWTSQNSQNNLNNTFLYIAVEYVKDEFKLEQGLAPPADTFNDFDQHVSPLDPNMSSVARYSPVYSEPSAEYNPIVIHQLVQPDAPNQGELINNLTSNSPLETVSVMCDNNARQPTDNQFLQLVEEAAQNSKQSQLQLIHNDPDQTQGVELLFTDQETGISYSVVSQELLVGRCLDDEQLLNALTPDPLLESDLLALDENTLKTELNDDIINSDVSSVDPVVVSNYISSLTANDVKSIVDSASQCKVETRKRTSSEIDFEDQLFSRVYSIIDKAVPSRARASLPESYLFINKVDNGIGIFAKKPIPKRTQFGPLKGLLRPIDINTIKDEPNFMLYLVEGENGSISVLDVSDENASNWMSFVRKATTYNEQNLVMSQEGNALYFTTTKNVLPKQELRVGYSFAYAKRHKLSIINPPLDKSWPCFECSAAFSSSEEFQKHLNIHDDEKDENMRPRKKFWKNNKRKSPTKNNSEALKCNNCNELFIQPAKVALRNHLIEKHLMNQFISVDDHFSCVMNHKCEHCDALFNSEALLKIHNYQHGSDNSDIQTNHICPACQRKFPTQRQLVIHISTHSLPLMKSMIPQSAPVQETFKCPICHKNFGFRDRLRRHMMVHSNDESKPLQCKTCSKRFLNNSALAGHVKTHFVGKKVFECPICKESFDHVLKLKLHVPKHCENNLYSCPHCTKVFKKYSIIRKHIRAFHCEQKHSCPHCTKMFPTLDKLKMHLLRHSDHREFLCADCGKQFKRKDKLKEHCKRMHSEERENDAPRPPKPVVTQAPKKLSPPKAEPTDFHRFIYKCHTCLVGFKRRGMLVNHLAKRHPDIPPDSVPELNLPILQTTRDYYCQHCDKVYKSSSKRKAHILKNHPGAALPISNRKQGSFSDGSGLPNPTFSQTVGSITTRPQSCKWCHKQYASKAKLLQHQRKKHSEQLAIQSGVDCKLNGLTDHQNTGPPIKDLSMDENCLQDDFKVTEVDILNSALEEYNAERDTSQYCHLVNLGATDNFGQGNDLNAPNSHLYRLLTTSSDVAGMVPPR